MDLTGRTVLVTGASSGIGRETAVLLAELGARVVLTGRSEGRLAATLACMKAGEHRIEVRDLDALEEIPIWVKELGRSVGPFDGLVHSAGVHQILPLRSLSSSRIENVLRTNVSSALLLAKAITQKGCYNAGASLVFLSSVVATAGQPALSVYAASKAALVGMVKSLAMELARERVRVNAIAPGTVESEMSDHLREVLSPEQFAAIESMHPLGLGKPRDVANAAAFLLGQEARWITGTTLYVDGGYSAH